MTCLNIDTVIEPHVYSNEDYLTHYPAICSVLHIVIHVFVYQIESRTQSISYFESIGLSLNVGVI